MKNFVLYPFVIYMLSSCSTKVDYPYQNIEYSMPLIIENKTQQLTLIDPNIQKLENKSTVLNQQNFYKFGQRPFPSLILARDSNIFYNSVYLELQDKGYFNFGINSNYHFMLEFSGKEELINKLIDSLGILLNKTKVDLIINVLNHRKIDYKNIQLVLYQYNNILLIEDITSKIELDKMKFSELSLLDDYDKTKLISPVLLEIFNNIKNYNI